MLLQIGSTNSISDSQVSLDGSKEENAAPLPSLSPKRENSFELKLNDGMQLSLKDIKRFESREDEWRKRLVKKETEILKKMEKKEEEWKVRFFEKEKEWKKVVEKQEKEKRRLEEEIKKIEMTKQSLEHALKNAEGIFRKLIFKIFIPFLFIIIYHMYDTPNCKHKYSGYLSIFFKIKYFLFFPKTKTKLNLIFFFSWFCGKVQCTYIFAHIYCFLSALMYFVYQFILSYCI